MGLGIGIDTGGTYTDAVLYDFNKRKVIAKGKSLTTKEDLSVGIGNALDTLPEEERGKAEVLSLSTTLATNACVEGKGSRAKLILLGSSYEILDSIGAEKVYGLKKEDVLCLQTKSTFDGTIVEHPNWIAVLEEHKEWFEDAQALAIADVNAVHNGAICEKVAKEEIGKVYPVPFIKASELVNNLNMMERGATALLNARLLPIIEEFMVSVKEALVHRKMDMKTMIVRSDGSLMMGAGAVVHPVQTILSGPAASIIGGRYLADCENSLIVDMGGTTTDISIVKNRQPEMTKGIQIGGFRTQIKGVFIDTFGLGGDSRILVKEGRVSFDTRRVQSLCVAVEQCPRMKEDLKKLLEEIVLDGYPRFEFLYLVKKPEHLEVYTDRERKLISQLEAGPVMLGSGIIDIYNMKSQRLESEGIIMRCGLTPTDIMHIKGDFTKYDKEGSILGARYLLKALPDFNDSEEELVRLCDHIYDLVCKKLYENIIRILLLNQYPKTFGKMVDSQVGELIRQSWDEKSGNDFLTHLFRTKATLVGIGAPIHVFLPKVAQRLETACVIPDHAEVANAVGAMVADINVSVTIEITSGYSEIDENPFKVYGRAGNEAFGSIEEAIDFAKKEAMELVTKEARNRGALGELMIKAEVNPHVAYSNEGSSIDLGTNVVAYASGRI
ncbi:MAG: hydantoinase/oxoprolinase family protein [Eubacteriales bacterium]